MNYGPGPKTSKELPEALELAQRFREGILVFLVQNRRFYADFDHKNQVNHI